MKPRKKFRTRPKKRGAKKRQRIKNQKKRLVAAGIDEDLVSHMTEAQVRAKLKEVSRKKAPKPAKRAKKPAKKTVKKRKKKTSKKASGKTG